MSYIGQKPAERILTSADIADAAITSAKIADSSVTQPKVNSGVAGTGPAFRAYGSVNQTPSSSVTTKVNLNNTQFDTASCFNTSLSRFTPNIAGYYQFNGTVEAYAGGSNITSHILSFYKNGTEYTRGCGPNTGGSALEIYGSISDVIYMNGTTDYVELYAYTASGGGITWYAASQYRFFSGGLLRAV